MTGAKRAEAGKADQPLNGNQLNGADTRSLTITPAQYGAFDRRRSFLCWRIIVMSPVRTSTERE
jgi:hypothetical protein